jgi:hypothetical protein
MAGVDEEEAQLREYVDWLKSRYEWTEENTKRCEAMIQEERDRWGDGYQKLGPQEDPNAYWDAWHQSVDEAREAWHKARDEEDAAYKQWREARNALTAFLDARQIIYCPGCGEKADASDAFCRHCGCSLHG